MLFFTYPCSLRLCFVDGWIILFLFGFILVGKMAHSSLRTQSSAFNSFYSWCYIAVTSRIKIIRMKQRKNKNNWKEKNYVRIAFSISPEYIMRVWLCGYLLALLIIQRVHLSRSQTFDSQSCVLFQAPICMHAYRT